MTPRQSRWIRRRNAVKQARERSRQDERQGQPRNTGHCRHSNAVSQKLPQDNRSGSAQGQADAYRAPLLGNGV